MPALKYSVVLGCSLCVCSPEGAKKKKQGATVKKQDDEIRNPKTYINQTLL